MTRQQAPFPEDTEMECTFCYGSQFSLTSSEKAMMCTMDTSPLNLWLKGIQFKFVPSWFVIGLISKWVKIYYYSEKDSWTVSYAHPITSLFTLCKGQTDLLIWKKVLMIATDEITSPEIDEKWQYPLDLGALSQTGTQINYLLGYFLVRTQKIKLLMA